MKYFAAPLLLLLLAVPVLAQENPEPGDVSEPEKEYVTVPFSISFLPVIGMGGTGENKIKLFSINLLAGTAAKLHGFEAGGIANIESEDVRGAQLAGIANVVGDGVEGAQLAGIANVVVGRARGLQMAGIANVVDGSASAVQWAGIVNVAADTASFQVAGIANAAMHATGLQLGLVNVSETNDGYPVGYLSLVKDNPLRVRVWADETRLMNLGLKSGSARFHNMLVVGVQPEQFRKPFRWAVGAGCGLQIPRDPLFVNVSIYNLHINEDERWTTDTNNLSKLQVTVGYHLGPRLAIVGGASWNVFVSQVSDGSGFAPWSAYDNGATKTDAQGNYDDTSVTMWPGFSIGLEF